MVVVVVVVFGEVRVREAAGEAGVTEGGGGGTDGG